MRGALLSLLPSAMADVRLLERLPSRFGVINSLETLVACASTCCSICLFIVTLLLFDLESVAAGGCADSFVRDVTCGLLLRDFFLDNDSGLLRDLMDGLLLLLVLVLCGLFADARDLFFDVEEEVVLLPVQPRCKPLALRRLPP